MSRKPVIIASQHIAESPGQKELLGIKLSQAQRLTILRYTELPDHLAGKLAAQGGEETVTSFTPDELDDLLDHLEPAVYRAKGNERQKVQRIIHKVSERLGSDIDLATVAEHPPSDATVFQIKMTLKGIDPPIWRRIQTKDCTLERLHELIQLTANDGVGVRASLPLHHRRCRIHGPQSGGR